MYQIVQNPYYKIGVWANSGQRDLTKQKSKILTYNKVGKPIDFIDTFQILGTPDRSSESLEKAFSDIESGKNKVFHGLFWFIKHSNFDEIAIDNLKAGAPKKAYDIWNKITSNKPVTSSNYTAYNNLGTLMLGAKYSNETNITQGYRKGIALKEAFISSSYFSGYCHQVADETYLANSENELVSFLDEVINSIKRNNSLTERQPYLFISQINQRLKSFVSQHLVSNEIDYINSQIQKCKSLTQSNPENSVLHAKDLISNVKPKLSELSAIIGRESLKYSLTADKLAKEVLNSGIVQFKEFSENEDEYNGNLGADVLKLFKFAQSTSTNDQTRERIDENIRGITEWIESADEREKGNRIKDELDLLVGHLEDFQSEPDSISNAELLLERCKPLLRTIKTELGYDDALYIKWSSIIVKVVQGMVVSVFNDTQTMLLLAIDPGKVDQQAVVDLAIRKFGGHGNIHDYQFQQLFTDPYTAREKFQSAVSGAYRLMQELNEMDMDYELRNQFHNNFSTIKSFASQLGISSYGNNSSSSYSSQPSNNCYIATMVYGDINHANVIFLRNFRDETLCKYRLGRTFIEYYYLYSPRIVERLRNKKLINIAIKILLNFLTRILP